jgi:hypothetical protein
MKSFQQFLSEPSTLLEISTEIFISMDLNHNQNKHKNLSLLDVVWQGKIYRMEVEGKMMDKNELAEQLQDEYPGAIVHNVYPNTTSSVKVKNAQRYQPERLSWGE